MADNGPKTSAPAGLPGDPLEFLVMNEIGIIAQLSQNLLQSVMTGDMTVAQFSVLNHLLRLDAQQSIGELAGAMQVTQPTMSSTVRKLEDKALIRLVHDPDDRRIRRVQVTSKGKAARNQAIAAIAPLREDFAQSIPADVWEKLLPNLRLVRDHMDEHRP